MIVDLFSGCGGASLGMKAVGLEPWGFEIDRHACASHIAAGFITVQCDLEHLEPIEGVEGIWSSPPCRDYSQAGKKLGRAGNSGHLVDVTTKWVDVLRPKWVVCENVQRIKPVWKAHQQFYESLGYKTWLGTVNCADLGLPQTRKRMILAASLISSPAAPKATHSENEDSGLLPWVTMAEGLGWGLTGRPGFPFVGGHSNGKRHGGPDLAGGSGARQSLKDAMDTGDWAWKVPSATIVGNFRPDKVAPPRYRSSGRRQDDVGAIQITIEDALMLQGFPANFPVKGPKWAQFLQVGNAVPPVLAQRVLESLL